MRRHTMKLSFSLNAKPKQPTAGPSTNVPTLKKPAAFAALEDDEDNGSSSIDKLDAAPTFGDARDTAANKRLLAQSAGAGTSRLQKKRMEAERAVDSSVYEYDAVYDQMQTAKERAKETKATQGKDRKLHIHAMLESAATRKLDHLRAEEKMLQRERQAEGDEFADKEEFVTDAYKQQMAEVRAAEEAENKRIEAERKKRGGPPTGLAALYAQMLNQDDSQHQAQMAATVKPEPESERTQQGPNLTIVKPPALTAKSDLQLAKEAEATGKEVELNDDNEIVDKRELLSAGLNLSAPNTRILGRGSAKKDANTQEGSMHRAVGTAASRREINERRAREVQQQFEQEEQRLKAEREREELERTQRIVAKRNQDGDVQSAKERYLARKRRKVDEGQEAAPDGNA